MEQVCETRQSAINREIARMKGSSESLNFLQVGLKEAPKGKMKQ